MLLGVVTIKADYIINKHVFKINNFKIYFEQDNTHILIKDEYGNNITISKKNKQSILLNLVGTFSSNH